MVDITFNFYVPFQDIGCFCPRKHFEWDLVDFLFLKGLKKTTTNFIFLKIYG